jgi:endonuclease G, mitochondrial
MKQRTIVLLMIVIYLLLFAFDHAFAQDTTINTGIYKSYFSYNLKEPLYVSYKLYKGGGDCSRAGMVFKTDKLIQSATAKDYSHNGYDEGHLANAEDFASDCVNEEKTFRFYNCVPQTPRLNRGIWKVWETQIRKESQNDSLLVICGSIFKDKKIGSIAVPDQCWKIVISLTTCKVIHSMVFPNDDSDTVHDITIDDLIKLLPYKIEPIEEIIN